MGDALLPRRAVFRTQFISQFRCAREGRGQPQQDVSSIHFLTFFTAPWTPMIAVLEPPRWNNFFALDKCPIAELGAFLTFAVMCGHQIYRSSAQLADNFHVFPNFFAEEIPSLPETDVAQAKCRAPNHQMED